MYRKIDWTEALNNLITLAEESRVINPSQFILYVDTISDKVLALKVLRPEINDILMKSTKQYRNRLNYINRINLLDEVKKQKILKSKFDKAIYELKEIMMVLDSHNLISCQKGVF